MIMKTDTHPFTKTCAGSNGPLESLPQTHSVPKPAPGWAMPRKAFSLYQYKENPR